MNELDKLHHRTYDVAFDQLVLSYEFECPEVVTRYLQSLGETKSPAGELFRLAPRTTPINATGDFGMYTPATSVQYHQTPSPRIQLAYIQADLAAPHAPNWEVPAAIRPAAVVGQEHKVNSNLLGYFTSTPAAPKDMRSYTNLGFTAQQLPTDVRGNHQTSMKVLQTIPTYISLHTKIKKRTIKRGIVTGSLAQLMFVSNSDPNNHGRGVKYTSTTMSVHSDFQAQARLTAGTLVGAFRVPENIRVDNTLPHLGFTWNQIGANHDQAVEVPPPAGYAARVNQTFNQAQSVRLNNNYYN